MARPERWRTFGLTNYTACEFRSGTTMESGLQHAIVCDLCTGESNNLKDGIVDRDGVLSCRHLLNERTNSLDDLARTITLLYDTSERLAHLAEIRWFRA